MRVDITLRRGARRFEQMRQEYGEKHRGGEPPSRPEFLRLLLDNYDV